MLAVAERFVRALAAAAEEYRLARFAGERFACGIADLEIAFQSVGWTGVWDNDKFYPAMSDSPFPSASPSAPSRSPYRLVITDIDGTLLDDDGGLPDLNRKALAHCRDYGVRTCLATGRRWTTCLRLLDRLELRGLIDFCILNNGMMVRDVAREAILFQHDFPLPLLLQAAERLNAIGLEPIVLGHNPDGATADVFHRRDALLNGDFIAKNAGHSRRVDEWTDLDGAHIVELVLIGRQADLRAAAEALAFLDVELAILRNTYYAEYMLEITPKGVSKLMGANQLLGHLGLENHQALALGDSENDYRLLKGFPMSIAVANADARILAAAREITGSNAEGGFGQSVFRHIPAGAFPPGADVT
jgi:Cof subfamily protein (haloacid dehalogenase superfamily)